jgi:hypothetical protein
VIYNKNIALIVAFIGALIAFFYYMQISCLEKLNTLDFKYWDIQTSTPADFTLDIEFHPDYHDKLLEISPKLDKYEIYEYTKNFI